MSEQQYLSTLRDDGGIDLGTANQIITHYQVSHPNGRRALLNAARKLMARTGKRRVQIERYRDADNRYGTPDETAIITALGTIDPRDATLKITEGILL